MATTESLYMRSMSFWLSSNTDRSSYNKPTPLELPTPLPYDSLQRLQIATRAYCLHALLWRMPRNHGVASSKKRGGCVGIQGLKQLASTARTSQDAQTTLNSKRPSMCEGRLQLLQQSYRQITPFQGLQKTHSSSDY